MSAPQLTPDQAKFAFGMALPSLKSEHETTRRVIQAIPLDKGDYRPDAVSKSALELAWHIVASEKRFLSGIPVGAFDFTPLPRPASIVNSAGIAEWFDESFATNLKKLEGLGGEPLARMMDFRGMFQLPAVSFVHLTLNHTIHHRGQLSVYLRPMGAKVPSIYGESYDAAQSRLAKESQAG
jgi:uncharacterized damage-inducible protein DinB